MCPARASSMAGTRSVSILCFETNPKVPAARQARAKSGSSSNVRNMIRDVQPDFFKFVAASIPSRVDREMSVRMWSGLSFSVVSNKARPSLTFQRSHNLNLEMSLRAAEGTRKKKWQEKFAAVVGIPHSYASPVITRCDLQAPKHGPSIAAWRSVGSTKYVAVRTLRTIPT